MKKSKVDAIIRRKVAEARSAGICEGQRIEREKQTLLLTPQKDAVLLGKVPEHQYMRVPLPELAPVVGRLSVPIEMLGLRLAAFRAVQKCWATGEGHKVCWFEWQFEGVT